jgi:DNA-binding CsgD family transcriptional regulator
MTGWRCLALTDLGRFDEALTDAIAMLDAHDLAPISAISAAVAAARVVARRGEDAAGYLALATDLAASTGELQRIALAACTAAEDSWLRGESSAIESLTDAAWALGATHPDPWATGELAWWRLLGGVTAPAELTLAAPFALMVAGDSAAAAQAWDALGSPVWSAYALMLAPDAAAADRAVRALEGLGATQAVEAVLRSRRDRDLPLPRRPRGTARVNPAKLTARELDVLRLLADGFSNAEIADRLVISPRTAEHHISAVLRKLGEPTRARAVAAALRTGALEDPAPSG